MIYLVVHNSCHNHWFVNCLYGFIKTVKKELYATNCTMWVGLKGGFIVFICDRLLIREVPLFLLDNRYSWYQQMKIRWGPGGTQSFDTQGVHSRLQTLPQMYCQVYARRQKGMKKEYKFLLIGTTFCKFLKMVFTNHIFKIFYAYTKVPNSAKTFDHKILDWCPLECILPE